MQRATTDRNYRNIDIASIHFTEKNNYLRPCPFHLWVSQLLLPIPTSSRPPIPPAHLALDRPSRYYHSKIKVAILKWDTLDLTGRCRWTNSLLVPARADRRSRAHLSVSPGTSFPGYDVGVTDIQMTMPSKNQNFKKRKER